MLYCCSSYNLPDGKGGAHPLESQDAFHRPVNSHPPVCFLPEPEIIGHPPSRLSATRLLETALPQAHLSFHLRNSSRSRWESVLLFRVLTCLLLRVRVRNGGGGPVEAVASPMLYRHLGRKCPEGSGTSGARFGECMKVNRRSFT